MRKKSPIWTESKDNLLIFVKKAQSFSDIFRSLGLVKFRPNDYVALKQRLSSENIDFSHIKSGWNSNKGRRFDKRAMSLETAKEKLFICDAKIAMTQVKKYLRKYNLIEYKCAECGLEKEWNNKPISLQIDHTNGKSDDHRLENLRWLCPNCHSQTSTFSGRNIKINRCYCIECGKIICKRGNKTRRCLKCSSKARRKITWPSKEELEILVSVKPILQIAKQFNVTDNTIRKWCKCYGIIYKRRI